MADDIDLTQNNLEMEEELRKRYASKPVMEAPSIGKCLNCGTKLDGDKRWCDKDCQDDWTKRQR